MLRKILRAPGRATGRVLGRAIRLAPLAALLSGCNMVVLNPAGDVAVQQRDLIVASTVLMLLIIVPVIVLTLIFAWRYRAKNTAATYDPDWHHSTRLEVVIWAAPLTIIVALGALTWVSTHILDPYRPISRISESRPVTAEHKPLNVDVVSLDWKWLFIYRDLGIATVNELAAPVDTPLNFRLTSSSVMNTLAIPAMAGMVYSMPGMETQLHAVMNKTGVYEGYSANYSGAGFSDMHFRFHVTDQAGFDQWVAKVRASGQGQLGRQEYQQLERPTQKEPVRYYAAFDPGLFQAIVGRCVESDKMCMGDMMHSDARGGLGRTGAINLARRDAPQGGPSDKPGRPYVLALCTTAEPSGIRRND